MNRLLLLVTLFIILFPFGSVFATPKLQLDFDSDNVYYDNTGENVTTSDTLFDLVALVTSDSLFNEELTISVALYPGVAEDDTIDFGSFTFAGQTVEVVGDMTYGTPPIENVDSDGPHDLQSHSIFPTYFKEFKFEFTDTNTAFFETGTVGTYNVQDNPGEFDNNIGGTGTHYAKFAIDTTNITDAAANLHFDLYRTELKNGVLGVKEVAPFSHDAQFVPGVPGVPQSQTPEPATIFLFGIGLIGFAGVSRRKT